MTRPTPDIHSCGPFCTRPACIKTERDKLLVEVELLKKLLSRYRNETPTGHQPYMICHEVDAALTPQTKETP